MRNVCLETANLRTAANLTADFGYCLDRENGPPHSRHVTHGQPSKVDMLDVLLRDDPNPSPEVAEIWAERLGNGMTVEQIITYALLHPHSSSQVGDEVPVSLRFLS